MCLGMFGLIGCRAAPPMAQVGSAPSANPAQSIVELRRELEKILADTHTPGMSVAIVRRDGAEWVTGLGKSNVAVNQAATEQTLFRIGSVSKGFVALSVLKLVNEGRLSLLDPVRKVASEIWFENQWEHTNPVLVVDLLEHTTGWDEMHPREFAKDAKGMTVRQGLDYNPRSRVSRWRPGTRMAYCNTGPAVAAYIVEKVTGKRFEDYVRQNLFLPIGMRTATYFERPSQELTTLYKLDGKTPYPYGNLIYRPSGAINASAKDMAAYVQLYLNRGSIQGTEIMPASSIERMESPTRTWAAQEGLTVGYGLCMGTGILEGFVHHGHDGAVPGGLSEMDYMPDNGVGYFYSINSDSAEAFTRIGVAIRAYVTRGLTRPAVPATGSLPANAADYAGWYEPAALPMRLQEYSELLLGLRRVYFADERLRVTTLFRGSYAFAPVVGTQFRAVAVEGPVATAALVAPNLDGRFIQLGALVKRIPCWLALGRIGLAACLLITVVSTLVYAPFWMLAEHRKMRSSPIERAVRLWPFIAVVSLLAAFTISEVCTRDAVPRLGNLTPWSFSLFVATSVFGFAAVLSAIVQWRARTQQIRSGVRWFSIGVTVVLVAVAVYLAKHGVIGIRTWS